MSNNAADPLPSSLSPKNIILFWALFALLMLVWVFHQWETTLSANIAWLIEAADRLLEGGTYLKDAFETNPPLNVIIFWIPLTLAELLPLPVWHVLILLIYALIGLSGWAFFKNVSKLEEIDQKLTHFLTATYIMIISIPFNIDIADKEHFVAIALGPLILTQILITRKVPHNKFISHLILIMAAAALYMKPHFGLIPVALICHRMIVQKRLFSIAKDADFYLFALFGIGYITSCFIFFPDFTLELFPEILLLYVTNLNHTFVLPFCFAYGTFLIAIAVAIYFSPFIDHKRKILNFMLYIAILCFIPVIVQFKGFGYHFLPAIGTIIIIISLYLLFLIEHAYKAYKQFFMFMPLMIFAITTYITPIHIEFPRHDEHKELPILQYMNRVTTEECSPFFMFTETMSIVHQTALYSCREHASRFPSLWFMAGLQIQKYLGSDKYEYYAEKYINYVAEDFVRYKPEILFIQHMPSLWPYFGDNIQTLQDYFSQNETFKSEWKHYRKIDTTLIDLDGYHKGATGDKDNSWVFDVYLRNPETPEAATINPLR